MISWHGLKINRLIGNFIQKAHLVKECHAEEVADAKAYCPAEDSIEKLQNWRSGFSGFQRAPSSRENADKRFALSWRILPDPILNPRFAYEQKKRFFFEDYTDTRDKGSALLIVLIICTALAIAGAASLAITTGSVSQSGNYAVNSEASLASQAGLAATVSAIEAAFTQGPSSYPCTISGTLPNSGTPTKYSVTISYSSGGGMQTCNGGGGNGTIATTLGTQSSSPTTAVAISVGSMVDNSPMAKNNIVTMEENLALNSGASAVPDEAILTEAPLLLNNRDSIASGNGVGPANVSSPYFTCSASTTVSGSVLAGNSGAQILSPCDIAGNIESSGPVVVSGNVAGSVTAWLKNAPSGNSGITINNAGYVAGNVIDYGADINISQTGLPVGANGTDVYAYGGNLNLAYPNTVAKGVSYNATGTVTVYGRTSQGTLPDVSGNATPIPTFPKASPMPVTGSQNITESITSCNLFTQLFAQDVQEFRFFYPGTTTLTINAQACNNVTVSGNILFQENVNLYVGSIDIGGSAGFGQACLYTQATQSTCEGFGFPGFGPPLGPTSTGTYAFRVFSGVGTASGSGCGAFGSTGANIDITGSGAAIIASGVHLFLYTPGSVSLGNSVDITGQIYACSGLSQGGGGIAITYYPSSSLLESEQGQPGISVVNEYLVKG